MARIETDPNYTAPTFSRATAATDLFKKEDVQQVAAALSTHDHSNGKGVVVSVTSVADGSIPASKIQDGTITAAKLQDDTITSNKIANGTITAVDIANNSLTANKMEQRLVGAVNQLVNGGMELWNRGNGPFATAAAFCADRWQVYAPSGTTSVTRDTTNIDSPGMNAAGVSITTPANNGIYQIVTEGTNQFSGQTLMVSARVRCAQGNSVRVGIQSNKASSLPTTWSAYHTGGGGYETLWTTFAIVGGTVGVTVWIVGNVAGTFQVDNVMLIIGTTLADCAPLHPAEDANRCLRYFETSNNQWLCAGYNALTTGAETAYRYKAPKGGTPTITLLAASNFFVRQLGLNVAATSMSSTNPLQDGCALTFTTAGGLTAGQGIIGFTTAMGAVSVEWNP